MNRTLSSTVTMFALAAAATGLAWNTAHAQGSQSTLRLGIIGAANYNYVDAPTQKFVDVAGDQNFAGHDFSQAGGFEAYAGIAGEYMFDDLIGATLRATFDARCVEKEDDGSTFTPRLLYVSIEPGVRVNLGMPELHGMVGGTVAVKASAEYDYTPRAGEQTRTIEGAELQNVNDVAFGAWAGVGYDIRIGDKASAVNWFVTPFVEASYLFDQKEADVAMADEESWNTLTGRAGVKLMVQF